MFFNDDLLFLFQPKTGGTSLVHLLLQVLPPPCVAAPPGRDPLPAGWAVADAPHGHQTLSEAQELLAKFGRSLSDFKAIVVMLRDPYEQAVSLYAHMQSEAVDSARLVGSQDPQKVSEATRDAALENYQLTLEALDSDFESYVASIAFADFASRMSQFVFLDGAMPTNLRVIRLDRVEQELPELLNSVGITDMPNLTYRNTSKHVDHRAYYSPHAARTVTERCAWIFEHGFYEPMSPELFENIDRSVFNETATTYDLMGTVSQAGEIRGLYGDGWVGEMLTIPISARGPIQSTVVTGAVPTFVREFSLTLDGPSGTSIAQLESTGAFVATAPFRLPAGASGILTIRPSPTWSRSERGGYDRRRLSFYLNRVAFLSP